MKVKPIKFFLPQDNEPPQVKSELKSKPTPTGYISATGKLVFPATTIEELGIEPLASQFMIGTDQGKRKLKSLYLIPSSDQNGSFAFETAGRGGFVMPLALILKKGGVEYDTIKYTFAVTLFNYQEGVVGYQLQLISSAPKPEYTGKPRGRKPKSRLVES